MILNKWYAGCGVSCGAGQVYVMCGKEGVVSSVRYPVITVRPTGCNEWCRVRKVWSIVCSASCVVCDLYPVMYIVQCCTTCVVCSM